MLPKERYRFAHIVMRSALQALILISALAAIASSVPSARIVRAGPNCDADTTIDSQEEALLDLINDYRANNGLASLVFSDTLNSSAAWKSEHMATNDYFGHDDAGINRDFADRLRDCGYTANTWLAENIAAGHANAADTFEQWRTSSGHNANMLNQDMVAIGIARVFDDDSRYGWYWTAEFGGVADGFSDPAPSQPPASLPDKSGDVDCANGTTSIDAALVLQFSAALLTTLPCEDAADVSGDEQIGAVDATIILQISAGFFA